MRKKLRNYFYPFLAGLVIGSFIPHTHPVIHTPTWLNWILIFLPWIALIGFWIWLKLSMGSDMSQIENPKEER